MKDRLLRNYLKSYCHSSAVTDLSFTLEDLITSNFEDCNSSDYKWLFKKKNIDLKDPIVVKNFLETAINYHKDKAAKIYTEIDKEELEAITKLIYMDKKFCGYIYNKPEDWTTPNEDFSEEEIDGYVNDLKVTFSKAIAKEIKEDHLKQLFPWYKRKCKGQVTLKEIEDILYTPQSIRFILGD